MHHSWLYCVGAGILAALGISGAILIGFLALIGWFLLWERLVDDDYILPCGGLSLIFIFITVIGTLICKGVIK